eukprot:CAMPEP_0171613056 /NCGR_PEP_ID=MMETSP0990-20121206/11553_1 /TAXON_ID=483369 /ORGANISM="non described non described, Strain CCMP2098" /LENGTH=146 /DNA_ID=CAMNT_0012176855 /DNA_START=147 /DNA_END=587 /DNA_ORIENTATION=-
MFAALQSHQHTHYHRPTAAALGPPCEPPGESSHSFDHGQVRGGGTSTTTVSLLQRTFLVHMTRGQCRVLPASGASDSPAAVLESPPPNEPPMSSFGMDFNYSCAIMDTSPFCWPTSKGARGRAERRLRALLTLDLPFACPLPLRVL